MNSSFRGHKIYLDKHNTWRFSKDNREVKKHHKFMPCGHCGKSNTKEGHDGCLGTLDENKVMNACCGHGKEGQAYVQFWNGNIITGKEAIETQKEL